jgi:hypothetical protein
VPPGELRVVGVGEMLGDDALKVGVDHGPVQRAPFADDAVGEHNPALGPFTDPRQRRLAVPERSRRGYRRQSVEVPRIGSKDADQDGAEVEAEPESCMPGNVDDAGCAWLWRLRCHEPESERGLHD